MVEFRTSAGLITCTPYLRTAAGLVECSPQFRTAAGLIDVGNAAPLTAKASPAFISGARGGNAQRVYTNLTTVTATGGKPPYTFAWSTVVDWQVTSPTSATTSVSSVVNPGGDKSADFICTVTDARGATATASVNAVVYNYGGSGGVIP